MSGRGAGFCGAPRGAFGWARSGRGYRNRFYSTGVPLSASGPASWPTLDPQQEELLLQADAKRLRSVLESIEQRLEKLGTA
jgi:hypothetical protein